MGGVNGEAKAVLDCQGELEGPEVEPEGLDGGAVQPVPSVGQREGGEKAESSDA